MEASTGNKVGGVVEAASVSSAIQLIKDQDLLPSEVEAANEADDDLFSVTDAVETSGCGRLLNVAPIENSDKTSHTSLMTWFFAYAVAILCIAAFLFAIGLALYLPHWIVQDIRNRSVSSRLVSYSSRRPVRINRTSSPILFWFNISWRTVGSVAIWVCLIWCLRRVFFSSAKPKYTVTKSSEKNT